MKKGIYMRVSHSYNITGAPIHIDYLMHTLAIVPLRSACFEVEYVV